MQYTAIIQARMGSTRLPGKVMRDLCGKPLVWHIIERLKRSRRVCGVILATTDQAEDGALFAYAASIGTPCFRGSEKNVLDRFAGAARTTPSEGIVRVTADDPLLDPEVLDETIGFFEEGHYAYAATRGFPLGLGMEVFQKSLLEEARRNATEPFELEHVTPYMYRKQENYGYYRSGADYSQLRFTVDTDEDFAFVEQIYQNLYHGEHNFYLADILRLLDEKPELCEINSAVKQKGLMD